MRNNPTARSSALQHALYEAKMNNYTTRVHASQAAYQSAFASAARYNQSAYLARVYGGRVVAQRDNPLSEKRCGGILLRDVPRLQRAMCGRGSWLQRRRRAAHAACLAMIQLREAALAISLSDRHSYAELRA